MTKIQRFENVILGLLMIVCAGIMVLMPDMGYYVVALILSISLLIFGIRFLFYYLFMARFMVGGKINLYIGIIIVDLGLVTMLHTGIPKAYVVAYLVGLNLFTAAVDMLAAIDAKRLGADSWRLKYFGGMISAVLAIACLVNIKNTDMMVYIYSFGMVYSAVIRIITAFKKSAIVYIQ